MTRRVRVVSLGVALAAGVLALSPPSASAHPSAIVCPHSGRVTGSRGMTSDAHDFAFRFKGLVGPCEMPDGSTRSGTEVGAGRVHGGCETRTAAATWTITWTDKKKSVVHVSFTGIGNVVLTSGDVVRGQYAGSQWRDTHFLSGFDPTKCASPGGVPVADYQGTFIIARPG
jgi:hypothetical protein